MATSAASGGTPIEESPKRSAPDEASAQGRPPFGGGPAPKVGAEPPAEDLQILDSLDRTRLFGLDFVNAPSLEPVVDAILTTTPRDDELVPALLTPNVDIVVHLDRAEGSVEAEMFRRAQFCLPDGAPIVAVSRLFGETLQARLPGSGLFGELWPTVADRGVSCIVVAASEEIARRLGSEHPGARFVVPPMFDADDEEALDDIADRIVAEATGLDPALLLIGIGNPKDARIMATLFRRWPARLGRKPLCLGLGGSFAMYLGLQRRAPVWVQSIGMEWFFRFAQEPRRLFHRYFVEDLAFVGIVWRAWRARADDLR